MTVVPGGTDSLLGFDFELPNLGQQFLILWETRLDQADHSFPVDQEANPPLSIQASQLAVIVRNQRKLEAEFRAESFVRLNIIRAYSQNLGVQAFKL
jgi:hypothetical protein